VDYVLARERVRGGKLGKAGITAIQGATLAQKTTACGGMDCTVLDQTESADEEDMAFLDTSAAEHEILAEKVEEQDVSGAASKAGIGQDLQHRLRRGGSCWLH